MKYKMSITDTTGKNNIKDIKSLQKSFKDPECIEYRLRPRSTVIEVEIEVKDFDTFLDLCAKLVLHQSKISNAIFIGIASVLKEDIIPAKYSFENFDVKMSVTGRDIARDWIFFTIDATVISSSNKTKTVCGFKVPQYNTEATGAIRYDYEKKQFIVEGDKLSDFIDESLAEYVTILYNAGVIGGKQSCIMIERDNKKYLVAISHHRNEDTLKVVFK